MGKKILFINQEMTPYCTSTPQATIGNVIPQIMQKLGWETRVFMPKWSNINERKWQLHEVIRLSGINLIIDDTDHPLTIKVASIPNTRIQVYFIDNNYYFPRRKNTEELAQLPEAGDIERAVFFARGVLETIKKLHWIPDIVHCSGWITAPISLYIKVAYEEEPFISKAKVITTLSDYPQNASPGENAMRSLFYRNVTQTLLKDYKEAFDYEDLMHLAVDFSDVITISLDGKGTDVVNYAKQKEKLILAHPDIENIEDCKQFYDKVATKENAKEQ